MTVPTVFIIEDREYLADLYAGWLADSYTVRTASGGHEALDTLSENCDLIFLDHRLPTMPAHEILAEISSTDIDCPVVMLTTRKPNIDLSFTGFDDYLCKPCTKSELQQTAAGLLKQPSSNSEPNGSGGVRSKRSIRTGISRQTSVDGGLAVDARPSPRRSAEPGVDTVDMSQVASHTLPPVVSDLADEYETRLGHRDRFLLKWLHVVFPFFQLSSVDDRYAERCRADKTLASMYVTLIDDLGERHNDQSTLTEAAKVPFPHESVDWEAADLDLDYLNLTESVWQTLEPRLRDAPRYDEIKSFLRYDLRQVIHAVRYSMLASDRPEMANMTEAQALGAHNMMMLTYADIDLAYSPEFTLSELGSLRSLLVELQEMARIGNWVTTWERELTEGDMSAGVFITAAEHGIISRDELRSADDPAVQRRIQDALDHAYVEEALFEQWQQRCDQLRADPPAITSIDVDGLLDGMERVMEFHLASRGLK
jgi:CheY-like chemotaxis protein